MNRLLKFKNDIKGKRVGLIGIGISNLPVIEYLKSLGACVVIYDVNKNLLNENSFLMNLDIEYHLGDDCLKYLSGLDYIFRSPGVKPFLPELKQAEENGTIVTSEIEMLVHLCPCKIIAVTGSDGKTTTTTLISKFLEKAGYKVWLGGNIGKAIFSKIDEIEKDDIVVLELSSFQLMTLTESSNVSVITNISENHLDYHRSYDEYIDAKANIFKYQNLGDVVVFNADDEMTDRYLKSATKDVDVRYFSLYKELDNGVYLSKNKIIANIENEEIIDDRDNVKLVGIHNIANICAAIAAVTDYVKKEDISYVMQNFSGVEHRMELINTKNTVKWYNDSIATSPSRTIAGLESFNQKVILIAGGYDKNLDYNPLAPYILDKVKTLILIGQTASKIENVVKKEIENRGAEEKIDIITLESMEECVNYANSIAQSNDIIVLSPASASFGMYKNFEARGNHFKKLVNNLK